MSSLRGLARTVIRNQCYINDGNTNGFAEKWKEYHCPRTETTDKNGKIVSKRLFNQKKKCRHNDNGKVFVKQLKSFKAFLNTLKEKADETKKKKNTDVVTE